MYFSLRSALVSDTFLGCRVCFTEIRRFPVFIPASFLCFSTVEFCPTCAVEYAVVFH